MILVMKPNVREERIQELVEWIESQQLQVHILHGESNTVLGIGGDTSQLDEDLLLGLDLVQEVRGLSEPFQNAHRNFHPKDTVITVGKEQIGRGHFTLIAGPCSVESREQILAVAQSVKRAGATMLRGGAFKPRTSPYDFQGMKAEGLELLLEAKKETGLPIVSEIMSPSHLPLFEEVDVIQVGARNMQNFELLKELGRTQKPILIKRGLANTIRELLMSAEYVMASGNHQVILCERGVRTFETATRNTLDLSAVPVLHELTHLPVIVDPSHATGVARYVECMSLAAVASGVEGLMIEVHNDPSHALCDGPQSLSTQEFHQVAAKLQRMRRAMDQLEGELS